MARYAPVLKEWQSRRAADAASAGERPRPPGRPRLTFDHAAGLAARGGGAEIEGFEVAGVDRTFVPARARVEGNTLIVSAPSVSTVAAVRYGWAKNPKATLVNGAGLPASPFRTDDWPMPATATTTPPAGDD